MGYTASELYGGPPPPMPSPTPVPDHAPGTPEPTHAVPAGVGGVLANPTAALIVLLALAVLLIQVSVRIGFEVEA